MTREGTDFRYGHAGCNCSHDYLLPAVCRILKGLDLPPRRKRLFDLGFGNGSVGAYLVEHGWAVTGVDPSDEGTAQARAAYPQLRLEKGSCYERLDERFGRFPVVISLEVVEHVYYPREFASCVYSLLEDHGTAIISTPYHGYIKNLALALSGRLDHHFTALWDNGHIKFWSERTLRALLDECGFRDVHFLRVGRIPALAKSMVGIASR